jgi:hypothetical protein
MQTPTEITPQQIRKAWQKIRNSFADNDPSDQLLTACRKHERERRRAGHSTSVLPVTNIAERHAVSLVAKFIMGHSTPPELRDMFTTPSHTFLAAAIAASRGSLIDAAWQTLGLSAKALCDIVTTQQPA